MVASMEVRARRAAALVCAGLALLGVCAVVAENVAPESAAAGGTGGTVTAKVVADELLQGRGEEALAQLGVQIGDPVTALPAWFLQQVMRADECHDVLVSQDEGIIGFTWEGSAADLLGLLRTRLQSRGWQYSANAWKTAAYFTKEGGEVTWLCVLCYQVGDRVSAVLQYR